MSQPLARVNEPAELIAIIIPVPAPAVKDGFVNRTPGPFGPGVSFYSGISIAVQADQIQPTTASAPAVTWVVPSGAELFAAAPAVLAVNTTLSSPFFTAAFQTVFPASAL